MIGFSVGHKYKSANPGDRGAPVLGGGWEADYAEAVLEKAKVLLGEITALPVEREIQVVQGRGGPLENGDRCRPDITWDAVRGILHIEP